MLFNSFEFLWLFPIIFCIYYLLTCRKIWNNSNPKIANYLLIAISYGLYIQWKPVYVVILLGVTAITYLFALIIDKEQAYGKKKYLIYCGITLAALPLLVFKYYNFLDDQISELLSVMGIHTGLPGLNWVMPLGISFFTLQAVGYLADVYLQRIKAEHNWWDYMLFVSFFPQIASGPISKASDLMPQIKAKRLFNYPLAVQGLKWLLWGMFLKVVIADNLGLRADLVFNNPEWYSGLECLIATFLYTFQIYCDFAGYSFMALGVGNVLGFSLINNFKRPYFSQSITEFWHRWHISLSTWLKDYIYIPLGGSRCSRARNYWNIMVTFFVSGLWHGANWTFILWGLLHGLTQIIEKALSLNRKQSVGLGKIFRMFLTFLLVSFFWILFRTPTFEKASFMINKIFTDGDFSFDGFLFWLMLISIVVLKDLGDEYNISWLRPLHSKFIIVRWATYLCLTLSILIAGVYGGQFIYSGF